jgi:hypothetical protein
MVTLSLPRADRPSCVGRGVTSSTRAAPWTYTRTLFREFRTMIMTGPAAATTTPSAIMSGSPAPHPQKARKPPMSISRTMTRFRLSDDDARLLDGKSTSPDD